MPVAMSLSNVKQWEKKPPNHLARFSRYIIASLFLSHSFYFSVSSFQYYAELTLQDAERFLKHLPSAIASGCAAMALHSLGMPAWVRALFDFEVIKTDFDAALSR